MAAPLIFNICNRHWIDQTVALRSIVFTRSREVERTTTLKDLFMRLDQKNGGRSIDDVERGGLESCELRSELLRLPDTPPMLFLRSYPTDRSRSRMLETLHQRGLGLESFEIRLRFDDPPVISSCA